MNLIQVEVTPGIYERLRLLATVRGETVTELFVRFAYRMSKLDPLTEQIALLWAEGMTDKQIAASLNLTNRAVSDRRRIHLLLPANFQKKGTR